MNLKARELESKDDKAGQDPTLKQFAALVLPSHGGSSASPRLACPLYWFALEKPSSEVEARLEKMSGELLCDSVDEVFCFAPLDKVSDFAGHIDGGFKFAAVRQLKSGVTDNTANSVAQALAIMGLGVEVQVSAGTLFLSVDSLENVAHNSLTEKVKHFQLGGKMALPPIPERRHSVCGGYEVVDINLADQELVDLSKERLLSLNLEEMQTVKGYFADQAFQNKRKHHGLPSSPTDVELEIIAQTWSEHCKHKIFNATIEHIDENGRTEIIKSLYKSYIKAATEKLKSERPDLLSVFEDNAGVVAFDEEYAVCFKVETHNSPSALEPYGGALTGILGVNRDILGTGLGAKPIFNTDVFCLPHPDSPFVAGLKHDKLLSAKEIVCGVRKGVQDGGNKSGIPTVNGAVFFDDSYRAKPLVYCGTGGLLPLEAAGRDAVKKHTAKGDYIVMAGGRVGRDGVHGATFSSLALDDNTGSDVVQIGDPFTQKRLLDFVLQARDGGLVTGLTDNGAGGLSSSVGEMASITGGALLEIDSVPLKYPGLFDWQIVVSESQERMTFSTDKPDELLALAAKLDVEATVVGRFTDDGYFRVVRGGATVALLNLDFLHGGAPGLKLKSRWQPPAINAAKPEVAASGRQLLSLLANANICSREPVIRQYDHEVQGGSVIKPLMGPRQISPCDAGVLLPRPSEKKGIAVACGMAPRMSTYDPALMAKMSVDEAVRSVVSVGADPDTISLLDNFCWPDPVESPRNPDAQTKMAQLVLSVKALHDICLTYKSPLISGKDSMKNDFDDGRLRLSVLPTLLVSSLAMVPDAGLAVSSDFKQAGDLVYLLSAGTPSLLASQLVPAASAFDLPCFDEHLAISLYRRLYQAISQRLVRSCHDVSDGGLAVCLAESAMGGNLGLKAELNANLFAHLTPECDDATLLFGEGPGMIVASVAKENQKQFEEGFAGLAGLNLIGSVLETASGFTLKFGQSGETIKLELSSMLEAFQSALPFEEDN
ncbi:MAG: phosphoribosylformylglycinamidine synthase [Candidatus Obscuribacter sp.]|nr:phosphoribosylformylglycinamidine synthase [Candidatus Obscuribacter sp.]